MRKATVFILLFCCLFASILVGCGRMAVTPESGTSETNDSGTGSKTEGTESEIIQEQYIDYQVQYLRGYYLACDTVQYPKTVWITSVGDFEEFFNTHLDAESQYNDIFFKDHDLLLVLLEEISGSIWHEVTGVKVISGQTGQMTVQPEIERLVPKGLTCDMAGWAIVLEIGKEYGKASTGAVTPVITTKNST